LLKNERVVQSNYHQLAADSARDCERRVHRNGRTHSHDAETKQGFSFA
jgi:hypothetical protein